MKVSRREFVKAIGAVSASLMASGGAVAQVSQSSPVALPAVGLGSWITFNVGNAPALLRQSAAVVEAFVNEGGGLIDSSPMYGSAQNTIGYALNSIGHPRSVYAADKVWTSSTNEGPVQIENSARNWQIDRFDLIQVHNLRNWQDHLDTLFRMREDGEVTHVGVTTSHGRRHRLLEDILREQPVDFVQLTYNPVDRAAEGRLLPLARERGISVIVNRPFRRGSLTERLEPVPLPAFAREFGATTWAQLILLFIKSHPGVTVVIPATTQVEHVRENKAVEKLANLDDVSRKMIQDAIRSI
ncbi:MAG: aldo/keto reductase [Pseudomonadota bacterium]